MRGPERWREMDIIRQVLAGLEQNLISYTTSELEEVVQLLSDQVQADREQLGKTKAELLKLKTDSSSEREFYISLVAHTADLDRVLSGEAKTQVQLHAVSQELETLLAGSDPDSREAVGDTRLEQQDVDADTAIAFYNQKESQLLEERERLQELLQTAHTALAKAQLEHDEADDELRDLQRECSGSGTAGCPGQSEDDQLLDACIKEMGLLRVLPDKRAGKSLYKSK
ncbi:hypothetical protein FKM82_015388 [Ascaphus truei]